MKPDITKVPKQVQPLGAGGFLDAFPDDFRPTKWRCEFIGGPWDGHSRRAIWSPIRNKAQSVMVVPGIGSGIYQLVLNLRTGRACWRWTPADLGGVA